MTPPDLAAIRARVYEYKVASLGDCDATAHASAADVPALCDALDAARAECERLRVEAERRRPLVMKRSSYAPGLDFDALTADDIPALVAALREADAAWHIANAALDGIEDSFPVAPPTGVLGQRDVYEFSDEVRDVLYALGGVIGTEHATAGDAVRAVEALRAERDAARATIAAQAAEVERLRGVVAVEYANAEEADAEARDAVALAADALRYGSEECEHLREGLSIALKTLHEASLLAGRHCAERDVARADRDALRAEVAGLRAAGAKGDEQ